MIVPTTSGKMKLPRPLGQDAPDGPGAFLAFAQRMDLMLGSGVVYVADASGLAGLVTNSDAYEGLLVFQLDTHVLYRRAAAGWVRMDQQAHAEWTATSGSLATATVGSIGTLAVDATNTNTDGGTLATISTNTLTIAADGIYDLSATISIGTTPTGTSWIRVSDGTVSWYVPATLAGAAWAGPLVSGVRWTAGTVLTFQFFHTSAANRVGSSRIIMTRVGTF